MLRNIFEYFNYLHSKDESNYGMKKYTHGIYICIILNKFIEYIRNSIRILL